MKKQNENQHTQKMNKTKKSPKSFNLVKCFSQYLWLSLYKYML